MNMSLGEGHCIAAHYFGRSSMGNFWNSFEEWLSLEDLKKIKSDGFNTVFLIVPWAHFQPKIDPIEEDLDIERRFVFLLQALKDLQLKVVLRLGYLWDNSKPDIKNLERYRLMFFQNKVQEAWSAHVKRIKDLVVSVGVDASYFMCWEDLYWAVLRIPEEMRYERRRNLASNLGFVSYLKSRYSLKCLRALHPNLNISDFEEILLPLTSVPSG